ncbi:hypothetical protein Glove_346g82 [Diversispora epigaea]|uniref:Protein kinase domain-containing protein n=1 Tax=Diversispora epigaea TaxID=1348612 RepID=A0A397HEV7_9GLOM|nr:hypothetical protein Glove_346g82 [Diversispora epigaea]
MDRFKSRKLDGSNKNISCLKCKRKKINSMQLCVRCFILEKEYFVVNSGNKNIDNFIKKSQSSKNTSVDRFLEWVPYDEFKNIKYIGKGGFSQIYKATWKRHDGIEYDGNIRRFETEVVLKVLNNSQNVDSEFLKELKLTFQFDRYQSDINDGGNIIKCFGVTQDPQTKNYAFILDYARDGDLHHFVHKNFKEFTWDKKIRYLRGIIEGIQEIHKKKIIHRDLHSGNILVLVDNPWVRSIAISDLGFSQPASNGSRKSQIYGIIPYMAPELFRDQPYSYASDIYSIGMIMWELTSGHRPFHDQEHGPKLILDILDGKRPEITEDTPKFWANLMKRCWHPDPSQRPTIQEIYELSEEFQFYCSNYLRSEEYIKKSEPDKCDIWLEFNKADKKRLEMVKSKKPFMKNPGYEHPNSRYYSRSLNSMLESINSTITDLFSNNNLLSNDNFDIMNINSNQENNFVSNCNSSVTENIKKHFLNELLQENIEDQNDFKRRKIAEYLNVCRE